MFYSGGSADPWFILISLVAFFALICIIAFGLHRLLRIKLKNPDEKPNASDVAKEEIDRLLVDVEDKETAEAIKNYKQSDD